MEDINLWKNYYTESTLRFAKYYLTLSCEWGAKTGGSDATKYLSYLLSAQPNIERALIAAIKRIKNSMDEFQEWHLWKDAVLGLFNYYDYRGVWSKIEELLQTGIQVAKIREDIETQAIFNFYLGRLMSQKGVREQAITYCHQAQNLFISIKSDVWQAHLLHFLGTLYRKTDPPLAREYLEHALDILKRFDLRVNQASTQYEIGRLEEAAGNLETAESLYLNSLAVFKEAGWPREYATLLFQIGELRVDTDLLNQALEIYKSLLDERGYAQTLHQLGNVWYKKGDRSKAKQLHIDAIQIFERLGAVNSVEAVERDMVLYENQQEQN